MSTIQPCVYILASRRNGTLYVGVTSSLMRRVWQHRNDLAEGFTRRYRVHLLVWYETHATMASAIAREKAIKEWRRAWKLDLIESANPGWRDLYDEMVGVPAPILGPGIRREDAQREGSSHVALRPGVRRGDDLRDPSG